MIHTCILISALIATSAELDYSDSFIVEGNFIELADWAKANQQEIWKQLNLQIQEKEGNTYTFKKTTLKGNFIFTVKEDIEETPDTYTIKINLIDCQSGGIQDHQTVVYLERYGDNQIKIIVKMETTVNNPKVRKGDLKIDAKMCIKRIQTYMQENFR